MTTPHAQQVSAERPRADIAARGAATAEGPYVINLCSSTTPMALSQPQEPSLARFKFFVSRRLEDGRERFRLHMGYFESLADAEEWLSVVRDVYPGAWAGEAPGKRLRARAAGAGDAPATGIAAPARAVEPPRPAAELPRPASELPRPAPEHVMPAAEARVPERAPQPTRAESRIPANVPVLQAAPGAAVARPVASTSRPSGEGARPDAARTAAARPAAAKPVAAKPPAAKPPAARPAAAKAGAAKPAAVSVQRPAPLPPAVAAPGAADRAGARAGKPAVPRTSQSAVSALSNVREVLASLDETGATRQMAALDEASAARQQPADLERSLSDTQVLKLLEARRADGGPAEEDSSISLLKPDDSGTRRALKDAVVGNAPVSFAVQLQWSVQPIDAAKVPPLAIFSAYTLYTVEGSREGRRWYGLRLGFFSDAISAKQVAHYVRSEFNSVAVVPVSPQERGRASEGDKSTVLKSPSSKSAVRDRLPEPTTEFKLIDDVSTPAVPEPKAAGAKPSAGSHAAGSRGAGSQTAGSQTAGSQGAGSQTAGAPGTGAPPAAKRASKASAGRVRAREKRSPKTLEETLEILGADQLEIDPGRGETLNDTGVRHLKVQVRKDSPFTRLLDRLAERTRAK